MRPNLFSHLARVQAVDNLNGKSLAALDQFFREEVQGHTVKPNPCYPALTVTVSLDRIPTWPYLVGSYHYPHRSIRYPAVAFTLVG